LAEFMKNILARMGGFYQKTEKKKFILPAVLVVAVLTVGIVGAVLLNRVEYTVLYSKLSAEEAGMVMTVLKELGVSAKVKGSDTILVPEDQADELRIELAAQGYPSTGLNYDLFSNSSDIGSTDLERQTYLQYQLQENMRTTISRMSKVEDCIVIVNLATSSSFVVSNNITQASVALLLSLEKGEKLTSAEAKSIGAFVIKCVPKLEMENVSIVDSEMNYYNIVAEPTAADAMEYSDAQQQLTEQMKEILLKQALRVLEPAMGDGNIAVSVNLKLDFDKKSVSSVEFSPPVEGETQGLLISSEELHNAVTSGSSDATGGQAGTDSNGVSAPEYAYSTEGNASSEGSTKTYNYELNQIQTQIEKAQGAVQDLTVAVLVNSEVEGIDDYLGAVKSLVASAIGVEPNYISVEVMPFVKSAGEMEFDDYFRQNQEAMERLGRNNLIKTAIIAAALLVAAFMAMKVFLKKKSAAGSVIDVNTESYDYGTRGDALDDAAAKAEQERLIQDLVMKKSDEAEKVEDLMDRYPEAVVQILRTWLQEDR